MDLDLDPTVAESLSAEAERRGFETTEAYVRWLLEHRQSVLQPPGERIEARLEQLEGRIESLTLALQEGNLEHSPPSTPSSEPSDWIDASRETDTWDDTGTGVVDAEPTAGSTGAVPTPEESDANADASVPEDAAGDEGGFAFGGEADEEATTEDSVSEFAYSDDLEPPDGGDEATDAPATEPEDGADDDEIADAIADIDIDEEGVDAESDGTDDPETTEES